MLVSPAMVKPDLIVTGQVTMLWLKRKHILGLTIIFCGTRKNNRKEIF